MSKKEKFSQFICHNADIALKWLIYLSIVLIPLVFLPQVESVFTTPKLYVFRIITLLIILIWGLKNLFHKKIKIRWTPFFWFVIGYAAISILNIFVTVNFYTSLIGTYGRFLGIFTILNLLFWAYIVFVEFKSKERIKKALLVSVITACAIAFYGLLQYFDLLVNIFPWTQNPQDRVFSTIGHSNHTAAYLGMNLMLLLGLIFTEGKNKMKYLLWGGFGLIALTLILTASRGGFFAVIFAAIIWLVYILRRKKLSKKTFKYSVIGLILAAILGVILSGPISKLGVVERTVSTITFIQQGNMPDRVSWWLSSFEMIKDKPLLGHGLSTYKDIYNKYRRTDYKVPGDEQDHITPETAHNEYLNIAATQGLAGFAAYAAMIVMIFIYTFRYFKRHKDEKDKLIVMALLTAIIVYLIQVTMSFGTVTTLFIFFTLVGLLVSYINADNKNEIEFKNYIPFRILGIIIALLIFIYGGFAAFNAILAEYHFKQAQSYAAIGNFENTINEYDKTVEIQGHIPKYHEDYGNFLFEFAINLPDQAQANYLNDAINIYANAVKVNNHHSNILMNQGLAYSRLADLYRENQKLYEKYKFLSIEVMKVANERMRNNPFYPYKFGITLKFYNQYKDALGQFILTKEIRDPYKDTNMHIKDLLPPEETSNDSSDGDSEE
jgi:O-antigen ligase